MKRSEMTKVLSIIEDGWPGQMTGEAAALYVEGLADLDGPSAIRALKDLLLTSEYRPTVASVRRAVLATGFPSRAEALRQARSVARYREQRAFVNGSGYEPVPPVVHDAVARACVDVSFSGGRWERVFVEAYEAVMSMEMQDSRRELGA